MHVFQGLGSCRESLSKYSISSYENTLYQNAIWAGIAIALFLCSINLNWAFIPQYYVDIYCLRIYLYYKNLINSAD
jgi:hypothetical protein